MNRAAFIFLLATLCAVGTAAAQPATDGGRAGNAPGGTYLSGELAGAGPFLSLNVESNVWKSLVVRGGIGYTATLNSLPLALIGGVGFVPGGGTYRPEIGISATYVADENVFPFDTGMWPAFYVGVRFQASNGSLIRLGVTVFTRPNLDGFALEGFLPWPSLSFGGRL